MVLNLYPYNPGHLMVCPYRHIGWYTEVTDAERDEMAALTQTGMRVLQGLTGTQGFNIGMNQGQDGRRRHPRTPAPAHRAKVGG